MMSKPSAKACIMPYSMPLWTILTKWPGRPAGMDVARSARGSCFSRPPVRSTVAGPGASVVISDRGGGRLSRRRSSGSSRARGPRRRRRCRRRDSGCPWARAPARRTSSLKLVLPPSMIVSPGLIRPASFAIVSSVILPAGSMTQTVRGPAAFRRAPERKWRLWRRPSQAQLRVPGWRRRRRWCGRRWRSRARYFHRSGQGR